MDQIFIKKEIEDIHEEGSASSTSNAFVSRNSATSTPTVSLPPTQRILPSTLSPRSGVASGVAVGYKYFRPNESEHFRNESNSSFNLHGPKRKGPEINHSRSKHQRAEPSLLSPSLLPNEPSFRHHLKSSNLAMVPRHPQDQHLGAGSAMAQDGGVSQEDELKNIKVMLNCISGMVEKTQSAISILQQRQAEVANTINAEKLVAEVHSKAIMAILEVKQAALEEIKNAKRKQRSDIQSHCKEESCMNCGHPATETCSGCSLARYCGPFCQHKDWEDHLKVCRADLAMDDISCTVSGSPPDSEKEESKE